jgi:hypothetical protein
VHCATVMSTHEHLVVTDTRGELPRFLQELHRLLALGIKVLRKWEGPLGPRKDLCGRYLCTNRRHQSLSNLEPASLQCMKLAQLRGESPLVGGPRFAAGDIGR